MADVAVPAAAGMITPPPGLFAAAQQAADPVAPAPQASSMTDAVFVTSPAVPLVPTDDDWDATVVSSRKRPRSPWRLVLPDGQPYTIESTVLIGRGARPRAKWPEAKLLSVDDPTESVSKTHAVFEADTEDLWVTDLKSTNGVVVKFPDGREFDGDDGARLQIQPGSTITLGNYVIQVERD